VGDLREADCKSGDYFTDDFVNTSESFDSDKTLKASFGGLNRSLIVASVKIWEG
jgi:hypothetical protein